MSVAGASVSGHAVASGRPTLSIVTPPPPPLIDLLGPDNLILLGSLQTLGLSGSLKTLELIGGSRK